MASVFLKKNKILFLGILLFIFLAYLWLVWQPIDKLLTRFLVDDAFYYFKTAANIAKGLGPTFDGENLTNGYHPLWMGLGVLIYHFIPNDKILPIQIILAISVILFFITTLILWRIISGLLADEAVAGLLTLAYALNPWNASIYLNGLETPLVMFFLSLTFWLALKIFKAKEARRIEFLMLGIASGLMILARLDYGIFAAALFLLLLANYKRFSWQPILIFSLTAAFIAAPWFLYNYFAFGSFIPASGLAYTLINHRLWFYKPRSWSQILLWSLYNFFGTIAFLLKTIGVPVFYSGYNLPKSFGSFALIFLPPAALALYFYRKQKNQWREFWKEIFSAAEFKILFGFAAALLGLVIVHGAIRWSGREWYFASWQFLVIIALALFLSRRILADYRKFLAAVFLILTGFSFYFGWTHFFSQNENQREIYQTALWIKNNLPADARIASFNSGIMGYFSDRFVMDSDGLINNAAFEAMENNQLWNFFQKERIGYIADYEITLTYRYKSFLGIANPLERLQRIELPSDINRSGSYAGSHVNVYKWLN